MQDHTCEKQTIISRFIVAAILGLLVAGSGAPPGVAQGEGMVKAKPRKRVARGAGRNPVRTAIEPSIAFDPTAEKTTDPFADIKDQFTVIFSVQKIPTGGDLEDPWYLDYAVGDFYDFGGLIGWDIRWAETFGRQVPSPNGDVATDGSVTLIERFEGGQQTRRFTGVGVVDPRGIDPDGFIVHSAFDPLDLELVFELPDPQSQLPVGLDVGFTRIGLPLRVSTPTSCISPRDRKKMMILSGESNSKRL